MESYSLNGFVDTNKSKIETFHHKRSRFHNKILLNIQTSKLTKNLIIIVIKKIVFLIKFLKKINNFG